MVLFYLQGLKPAANEWVCRTRLNLVKGCARFWISDGRAGKGGNVVVSIAKALSHRLESTTDVFQEANVKVEIKRVFGGVRCRRWSCFFKIAKGQAAQWRKHPRRSLVVDVSEAREPFDAAPL